MRASSTVLTIIGLALIFASTQPVHCQGLYMEWNSSSESGWGIPPRVKDMDLDRKDEIVAVATGNPPTLVCFSYDGVISWQAPLLVDSEPTGISIGDLNGDGYLEVVCGTSNRLESALHAFDSDGDQMWVMPLEGRCTAPPLAYDLDWDGSDEVLVVDEGRGLHCVNGANGEEIWTIPKRMPNNNHILVADLERAGRLDVLWFQNKTDSLWIINPADGEVIRTLNGTGDQPYFGWPSIGDMDADGSLEIVISTQEEIICLDPLSLTQMWSSSTPSRYASAMGDVDGDGNLELVVPGNGLVTCLESDGSLKYEVSIENAGWMGSVCIADVDGDGRQEAVVAVHGTQILHSLDAETGFIEMSYASDLGGIFDGGSAMALADGDWDRIVEVYIGTTGEPGSPFLALSSREGSTHFDLEWPQFFHDWRGSGSYETTIVTVPEGLLVLLFTSIPLLIRRCGPTATIDT